MSKSATQIARALLESGEAGLEEWRIHEFSDDRESHDDEISEKKQAEFVVDFKRVQAELSREFGAPARTGTQDDNIIPLDGVFRFAIWEVGGRQLFVAAAHEDRGVPILLMIGAEADGNL